MVNMKSIFAKCRNCGHKQKEYMPADVPVAQNKDNGKIRWPYSLWNLLFGVMMYTSCENCRSLLWEKMVVTPVKIIEKK